MLKKVVIFCSFFLFLLFVCSFEQQQEIYNRVLVQEYFDNTQNTQEIKTSKEKYLGVLTVPKIHLQQGFYTYSSSQNHVDKNIQVLSTCLPNEDCPFLLASHSGSSRISYFKHLNSLNLEDQAIITYQNKEYHYILKEIYHTKKNGSLTLLNQNMSELILTTCNLDNQALQDVYRFIKEET